MKIKNSGKSQPLESIGKRLSTAAFLLLNNLVKLLLLERVDKLNPLLIKRQIGGLKRLIASETAQQNRQIFPFRITDLTRKKMSVHKLCPKNLKLCLNQVEKIKSRRWAGFGRRFCILFGCVGSSAISFIPLFVQKSNLSEIKNNQKDVLSNCSKEVFE